MQTSERFLTLRLAALQRFGFYQTEWQKKYNAAFKGEKFFDGEPVPVYLEQPNRHTRRAVAKLTRLLRKVTK